MNDRPIRASGTDICAGEDDVWMRIPADVCLLCDSSELSDAELYSCARCSVPEWRRKKADGYVFDKDRRLSLAAGLFIKVIEDEFGKVVLSEEGKPICNGICFNLSHSGRYVAFVSSSSEVGVDIETVSDNKSVYDSVMTRDEYRDFINIVPEEQRDDVFCRMWTAKESYMKALGLGLSLPPDRFRVLYGSEIRDEGLNGLRLDEMDAPEGYHMTVCSDHTGFRTKIITIGELLQ